MPRLFKEENLRLGNHIEKVLQVAQLEQGSIKVKHEGRGYASNP